MYCPPVWTARSLSAVAPEDEKKSVDATIHTLTRTCWPTARSVRFCKVGRASTAVGDVTNRTVRFMPDVEVESETVSRAFERVSRLGVMDCRLGR